MLRRDSCVAFLRIVIQLSSCESGSRSFRFLVASVIETFSSGWGVAEDDTFLASDCVGAERHSRVIVLVDKTSVPQYFACWRNPCECVSYGGVRGEVYWEMHSDVQIAKCALPKSNNRMTRGGVECETSQSQVQRSTSTRVPATSSEAHLREAAGRIREELNAAINREWTSWTTRPLSCNMF